MEKLYTFELSAEVLNEFTRVMERYRDVYVEKHFKSLDILKQLTELC